MGRPTWFLPLKLISWASVSECQPILWAKMDTEMYISLSLYIYIYERHHVCNKAMALKLTKSLQIWSDHSPQKVANNISIAIENYRGTEPLKDDQTMLIFRVKWGWLECLMAVFFVIIGSTRWEILVQNTEGSTHYWDLVLMRLVVKSQSIALKRIF